MMNKITEDDIIPEKKLSRRDYPSRARIMILAERWLEMRRLGTFREGRVLLRTDFLSQEFILSSADSIIY